MLILSFTACLIAHGSRCLSVDLQPTRIFDIGAERQIEMPMTLEQCQTGQAQVAIVEWLQGHPAYELRGGWKCNGRPKKEA